MCQGMLIVGGYFSSVDGGIPAHSIAAWDGTAWHTLGLGLGSGQPCDYQYVFAIACDGDGLVAGGNFYEAGGAPANHIARWDGEQWAPLGEGLGSEWDCALTLSWFEGGLVAGGHFIEAGGAAASHIARWDGASWSALGSGVNDDVYCLQMLNGDLIAGGCFHSAGGSPSWHIARRLGTAMDDVPAMVLGTALLLEVPNPYRLGQPIALSAPLGMSLGVAIYGPNGRLERTLFHGRWNGSRLIWDGRTDGGMTAGSGVYFCRARAAGWEASRRILRIR